jgi:hypothetical protein
MDSSYKTPVCRSSRVSAWIVAATALDRVSFADSGSSADAKEQGIATLIEFIQTRSGYTLTVEVGKMAAALRQGH